MEKEREKVWGLCESCYWFKDNMCQTRDKNINDYLSRESWPGMFDKDRCVRCQSYRYKDYDTYYE